MFIAYTTNLHINVVNNNNHFLEKHLAFLILLSDLMTYYANSSDPDQVRQNVGPDLDPRCLTPKLFCFFICFFSQLILI